MTRTNFNVSTFAYTSHGTVKANSYSQWVRSMTTYIYNYTNRTLFSSSLVTAAIALGDNSVSACAFIDDLCVCVRACVRACGCV